MDSIHQGAQPAYNRVFTPETALPNLSGGQSYDISIPIHPPHPAAPVRNISFIAALRNITIEDIKGAICPEGRSILSSSLKAAQLALTLKLDIAREEDPIDKSVVILKCVLKKLLVSLPAAVKTTNEYSYIVSNIDDLLDIILELAHLTSSARGGDFSGYEIIQLFAAASSSSKLANASPGALLAKLVNLCVPDKIFRMAAWNLLNSSANDFTQVRRITWPLFRLTLLPQTIATASRHFQNNRALPEILQRALLSIGNRAERFMQRGEELCYLQTFSTELIAIEATLAKMDGDCIRALEDFQPFLRAVHQLITNTQSLSSEVIENLQKASAWTMAFPVLDLLSDVPHNGVTLSRIKENFTEVLTRGVSLMDPREGPGSISLRDRTIELAKCGASLQIAKKANRVLAGLFATTIIGVLNSGITTLVPGLTPVAPFSYLRSPVSALYSCAKGARNLELADCFMLSDEGMDLSRIPSGKMFPYLAQHQFLKYRNARFKNQSFREALTEGGHIPRKDQTCATRLNSTLNDTHLVDAIRNPIAYTIQQGTGYYPEWMPGVSVIIWAVAAASLAYDCYHTTPIQYDLPPIQALGSGARVLKALRKGRENRMKKAALDRANRVFNQFSGRNLSRNGRRY